MQFGTSAGGFKFGHTAFFDQFCPLLADGAARFVGCVRRSVKQHHAAASLGGDLRDAATHGTSADDADGRKNRVNFASYLQYSAILRGYFDEFWPIKVLIVFLELHDSLSHDELPDCVHNKVCFIF